MDRARQIWDMKDYHESMGGGGPRPRPPKRKGCVYIVLEKNEESKVVLAGKETREKKPQI